jgi:AcrR family transcriptional regulator
MQKEEITVDLRKWRTRQAIIQAFEEIIQEKEFDAIRISDISKRAMINRVTFYHHFEDKYELLEVVTRESLKEKIEKELDGHVTFDQEMMRRVFIALTNFHVSVK